MMDIQLHWYLRGGWENTNAPIRRNRFLVQKSYYYKNLLFYENAREFTKSSAMKKGYSVRNTTFIKCVV
jgi:hypothetical protein